jgi:hypothetical protein
MTKSAPSFRAFITDHLPTIDVPIEIHITHIRYGIVVFNDIHAVSVIFYMLNYVGRKEKRNPKNKFEPNLLPKFDIRFVRYIKL